MSTETVYQTNEFEVVLLDSPEVGDVLESWGIPDALENIPQDSLERMREEKAFIILNKSNGSLGVIDSATLAMSFNEYHPADDGISEIRRTVVENILARATELDKLEESEDFYRGLNAFMTIVQEVQNEGRGEG